MTHSKLIQQTIVSILSFSILGTGVLSAQAQEIDGGLIISPAIMELNADKGGSYQFTMNLENSSAQDVYQLYPYSQKFTTNDDDGTPVLAPITKDDKVDGWVDFEDEMFTLKPGDEQSARFTVNIPADAEPGSYYLAVSYTTNNPSNEGANSVILDQEISSLLFITVKGAITRNVTFDEFFSNLSIVDPFLDDFMLTYRISSEGNAYLKPSGNIFVGDNSDRPDQNIALNPNEKIILPGTKRTFNQITRADVSIPLISSKIDTNKVNGDIVINSLSKPIIKNEKYDASLVFVNSDGILEQTTVTKRVFFFPWKTLLIAVVIALSGYGLFRFSRSYSLSHMNVKKEKSKKDLKKD